MCTHEERLEQARKDYEQRVNALWQHKNLFDAVEEALVGCDLDFLIREGYEASPRVVIWLKAGQSIRNTIVPFLQKLCKVRRDADLCTRFRRAYSGQSLTFYFEKDPTEISVYTTGAAACQWVQTGTEQVPVYSLVCEEDANVS